MRVRKTGPLISIPTCCLQSKVCLVTKKLSAELSPSEKYGKKREEDVRENDVVREETPF
jgi:hypothetical protein